MILLQKDCIIFVLIIFEDGLEVLLIEIFLRELLDHKVPLFYFSEPFQKHFHVLFDLVGRLGFDLGRDALIVIERSPSE